jgi:vacuolar protein sorting-associated protein 54
VESKDFQPYLEQVGSLYDTFQRAKEGNEENESPLVRGNKGGLSPNPAPVRLDENDNRRPSGIERRLSGVSASSRAVSPFDMRGRRRSSYGKGPQAVTPLSTIPNVYFEEDFHLENPRTFDVVSERSEVVRQPSKTPSAEIAANGSALEPPTTGRKVLATNAILQEKLSWYMDTVEIHLISSISTASKSFFTALGSLRELHAEAADSVERIKTLRMDLNKIDKEMAMGGLKVVHLRQRRDNVRKLADAMTQLHEVVEAVTECEKLVDQGDIEDAIGGLDEVERLLAGEQAARSRGEKTESESRVPVDLRGIHALQGVDEELSQLRQRIGMGYETRFLNDLLTDLRQHISGVPANVTLQRWGLSFQRNRVGHRPTPSISPAYLSFNAEVRSKLHVQLMGLGRSHYMMPAATSFKAAILREMKGLIRKHLPSSSDDDNESMMSASTHGGRQLSSQEKSSILARNLRALDPGDAYEMLQEIYTNVSEALRRLSVQVKVLLDITSALGTHPSPSLGRSRSPEPRSMEELLRSKGRAADVAAAQEEILQVLDMSSLLGQAVDIVQSQVVKVLKVRSEQTSHLPLEDFLKYFNLNRLFADECEAISGRSGTSLKTVVDNQIRDFIVRFSDAQRHNIVEVLDSDKWDAKDFGDAENAVLDKVIRASTGDVDSWSRASKIWESQTEKISAEPVTENGAAVNGSGKEKVRTATFDEQKYILPQSASTMMRSIEEFEHLTSNIPSMTQEIGSNLVECLKLFNSRSSQLILGAGATRSAGLKNITAKHLALSSQALSFIVALIPYVREFIRRQASSGQLIAEFDKVKRLCQEHQNGIHEKLVDIMSSRSTNHVAAMNRVDWDAEKDPRAVSAYMETLTKDTATVHRILARHFPDATLMMVMGPVFASYREQWTKAFQEATVKTESGRQR